MDLENECSKLMESLQLNVSPNISFVLEWNHFCIDSNRHNMVYSFCVFMTQSLMLLNTD
jgi:hypothetical protein